MQNGRILIAVTAFCLMLTALCTASADIQDMNGDGFVDTGDIVSFGSYPQSRVQDNTLLETLNSLVQTPDIATGWTSYGYWDNGEAADYALYQDVTLDGEKYRAVWMSGYRPELKAAAAKAENSYIDENGYELNTIYWFRWDPIEWIVLEYSEGSALLSAKNALFSNAYQDYTEAGKSASYVEGTETYANNWELSTIRGILNGSFLEDAFTEEEATMLKEQRLDNVNTAAKPESKFCRDQAETLDKVFLLSYSDLRNEAYGYASTVSYSKATQGDKANDTSDMTVVEAMKRRRSYTDYAAITGVRGSIQVVTLDGDPGLAWMLRSAGTSSTSVQLVNKYGSLEASNTQPKDLSQIGNSSNGIVPAIRVMIEQEAQ